MPNDPKRRDELEDIGGNRPGGDMGDERARGGRDEVRGIADEGEEEFDEAEDFEDEEEDERDGAL